MAEYFDMEDSSNPDTHTQTLYIDDKITFEER